jgi:UDP-3-O-[3-hydroxymyristoyl] glucosamine N-acyltransferase
MKRRLRQIAELVDARLVGDGDVFIDGLASIGSASAGDLVFVEDEKYLARALQSGAGAVIAGEFAAGASGKPLLICRHPKLTFARACAVSTGRQDLPDG